MDRLLWCVMHWEVDEPAWQYRVLDRLRPSIDPSQLDEALRLSPGERVAQMQRLVELLEDLACACGNRLSPAD